MCVSCPIVAVILFPFFSFFFFSDGFYTPSSSFGKGDSVALKNIKEKSTGEIYYEIREPRVLSGNLLSALHAVIIITRFGFYRSACAVLEGCICVQRALPERVLEFD